MNTPLQINIFREKNIESKHNVSAVVMTSKGQLMQTYGDVAQKIYPRSSIKCIQAIPIITTGAADKFNVSDIEIALASASHSGEVKHTTAVKNWLSRLNLNSNDLECGSHAPAHQAAFINLIKGNNHYSPIENNCSGKHTGMLASSLAMNAPTMGYVKNEHPLQQLIQKIIEEFTNEKIGSNDTAIDGCSLPTYFLRLQNLALAMARFADPKSFSDKYTNACERITKAIMQNPFYIAGTDRYCTQMTTLMLQAGFVKTGAEGVMFAALPKLKMGVAVKCHDGHTQAAEVAMTHILLSLKVINETDAKEFIEPQIKNWNGLTTGHISVFTDNKLN
jgi:L-asparaginase II